jgi:hypothetical protein
VEDTFVELARNNSGAALDAGIYVNRGTAGNNSVFYWDESEDSFKAATTTDGAGVSPLTSATLANVRVAEPADNSDAATKNYVDTELSAVTSLDLSIVGDDSSAVVLQSGDTLKIAGGSNINTAVSEPDTATINLNNDLVNITSIASNSSNSNLTLTANGTGSVSINNILTFSSNASTPTAASITKLYSKTAGSGGTGVFFINSTVDSGAEGELISKKKARAYAIALG